MLDADTVAVAEIPEVADAIARNRSFSVATWRDQEIQSVAETYENGKDIGSDHVQSVAEQSLTELDGGDGLICVRGCGDCRSAAGGPTCALLKRIFREDGDARRHGKMEGMG